ncbi:hypothetical protein ACM66B_006275 [Microbotryomycetes sp. NB124-2]
MTVSLPLTHSREGVTIDVLVRLVVHALYSIQLAVVALVVSIVVARHHTLSTSLVKSQWIIGSLAWLAIACMLRTHDWLNQLARNNWTRSKSPKLSSKDVVVITGASGGLGRPLVNRLADKGVRVAALDVVEPRDDSKWPEGIEFFQVDLTNRDDVFAVAERIRKRMGNPTVLVNNAGVVRATSILNSTRQDIDLTFDVNTKAHYWTIQAFLPEMIKRNSGHIVTVSSSTAYISAPNGVAYCASKNATLAFHEGLTLELRHVYNAPLVQTSIICPAHIKTNLFKGFESGVPTWLGPSLEIETVVDLVENVLNSGQSQHIVEPAYAKLKPLFRVLPAWLQAIGYDMTRDALKGVGTTNER